ncbi:hypothetical protein BDZ91DRAFT_716662 [Kalaharituber pfeilii]|nr:hypothetical protein BDZ91DRAFT_716662 [Kalaharituber pfeilii]
MTANMFTDPLANTGGGLAMAPLPQAMAEDVQITFDTEMIDEYEAMALQQQGLQQQQDEATLLAGPTGFGGEVQGAPAPETGMEMDTVHIASEKVHLRGVDTMATGDIEVWERKWAGGDSGFKKVEWIDDTSCNLVYQSSKQALNALNAFTDPAPQAGISQPTPAQASDLLLIRQARPCGPHPDVKLEVRIARTDDQKQKGARERSRFYLFNPEYDRGEEYERRRRGGRQNRRDRGQDVSPMDSDREYQRRYYDRHEHERRTKGDGPSYDDDMYDDDSTARTNSRRDRSRGYNRSRTRSRSGSRSRYSSRHDREQSRRRWRSPPPPPPREKNIELFPETLVKERKGLMAHHNDDAFYNPPAETVSRGSTLDDPDATNIPTRAIKGVELFPEKIRGSRNILGLANSISSGTSSLSPTPPISRGDKAGKELFPEKVGGPSAPSKGGLESRITLPGGIAPGGLLGYHSRESGGDENAESSKRKQAKQEDDLFAEKMAMGRRVGLGGLDLVDRIEAAPVGSGAGRRKGRRRAVDMFG